MAMVLASGCDMVTCKAFQTYLLLFLAIINPSYNAIKAVVKSNDITMNACRGCSSDGRSRLSAVDLTNHVGTSST